MWLINTKTLRLEEIVDPSAVKYAILSHTWGEEEVTFKDMHHLKRAKRLKGFVKIAKTCELALHRDLEYAWIDTCCINKTSSAELSEAINAMFSWYQEATVCFVFLEDLQPLPRRSYPTLSLLSHRRSASQALDKGFVLDDLRPSYGLGRLESCRWFTRGRTLQELIAPRTVEFYDLGWRFRFTKEGQATTLSRITRVDVGILKATKKLADAPVAVKMSWAAFRQTRRPEDVAYCLLGIFGINMPMLYGEGRKAFQRLQEAIMSQINDASLFAWLAAGADADHQTHRGILARSPEEFAHSGGIMPGSPTAFEAPRVTPTNQGIRLEAFLSAVEESDFILLPLQLKNDCPLCGLVHDMSLCLLPTKKGVVRVGSQTCGDYETNTGIGRWMALLALRQVDEEYSRELQRSPKRLLQLSVQTHSDRGESILSPSPRDYWSWFHFGFISEALSRDFVGAVDVEMFYSTRMVLLLLVFNIDGQESDVELYVYGFRCGHPQGWEMGNGEEIASFPRRLQDTDLDAEFERYKLEKRTGTYRPRTTVSVRRRSDLGLPPLTVNFEVKIDQGTIILSEVGSTGNSVATHSENGDNNEDQGKTEDRGAEETEGAAE